MQHKSEIELFMVIWFSDVVIVPFPIDTIHGTGILTGTIKNMHAEGYLETLSQN